MKTQHKITLKVNYGTVVDRNDNANGSRYYYNIKNTNFDKLEIIPSVKNLNRMALTKIDKNQREAKSKLIAKSKLVKKGKEWVVGHEKININSDDFILPQYDEELLKNVKVTDTNEYLDNLKKLNQIAKKDGKKMLFPCQNCDKICQNLAALKLHNRKHDPNAKPFKKKIWKHKVNNANTKTMNKSTRTEVPDNRLQKPKPIKHKHKCDPELKEFYEKNITGSDIEFWQFLKIFNKMTRDNIQDFKDLKGRVEYGVEPHILDTGNEASTNEGVAITSHPSPSSNNGQKISQNGAYKRVIRLNRKEIQRRNLLKKKLRENIAKN